jgi:hypothetical protein
MANNDQVIPPVNNDGNNDGNNGNDCVPIHHAQAVQGADGGINLKVEQTKLPEFWGQREKDSITANAFIQRVDNMMAANNWTDHIAFRNFALVLKGSADVWLKSQETLEDITGDRRAWTIVRPLIKAEFAIESDDKRILDGLAHLAMKQNENVRDYFGHLNMVNTIIMEAYDSYTVLPVEPVLTGNIQNDTAAMWAHVRASSINLAKFFLLNHFRAGLPTELRRVLNLQNEDKLCLNTAVKLATIEARSREEAKCTSKVYATQVVKDEELQIEAVRSNFKSSNYNQNRSQQPKRNQQQHSQQQNKSWRQSAGNNSNKNGQTCIFCKMQGHGQEECHKRMKAKQPCLNSNGQPFWPKVNTTDSNPTNNVDVPSFTFQDFQ